MNTTDKLIETDLEKPEVLSHIFASVITDKISSHTYQVDGAQGRDWGKKSPPTVREDQARGHLSSLHIEKSAAGLCYLMGFGNLRLLMAFQY